MLLLLCAALPPIRRALAAANRRELLHQVVLAVLAHVVFLGGVFLAAGQGLDAGLSALVCALQPLLVTAAGRLFFADHVPGRQWVGLAVALGGVALTVGGVDLGAAHGLVLVVASLLGLSAAALLERAWRPRLPVVAGLTVQVCTAAVVFLALALVTDGIRLERSGPVLLAIGWLVLLSGLGGYATFTWCLRHLGATTTSTLLYLTAPVTTLWAWMVFDQRPAAVQWAGLAVVLTGVAFATRAGRASHRAAARPPRPDVPSGA